MGLKAPLRVGSYGLGYRYNGTLHGRSVYRHKDVPGHNIFKGYSTWSANGHVGVGDALDCFCTAGTPVYAMHSGRQTVWRNDTKKTEVIYIVGEHFTTVYAHIDATFERTGVWIEKGQCVGRVRGDLKDPHLHLEVWHDGQAVAASTPLQLANKIIRLMDTDNKEISFILEGSPHKYTCNANVDKRGVLVADVRPLLESLGFEVDATLLATRGEIHVTRR